MRELDGAVIRDEILTPDVAGLLTIRQMKVYRSGTRILLQVIGALAYSHLLYEPISANSRWSRQPRYQSTEVAARGSATERVS